MKAWIPLTLVFALGTALSAQADCTYPRAPEAPPDGNTATKDQMIAAKHEFDRYNGEMKRLMLDHAFRFVRTVVFLVHPANLRSRRAVEKIGGIQIGTRAADWDEPSVAYAIERAASIPAPR